MSFDETAAPNFARAMPNWQPLVEYRRNGVAENTIHGAVSWVTGRSLLYSFGGNVEVYGRSMAKPLMMKVFVKEFAGALNSEQKAISVASHNGGRVVRRGSTPVSSSAAFAMIAPCVRVMMPRTAGSTDALMRRASARSPTSTARTIT